MLLLDVTVVNVALPAIQDDLGASFGELQWVVDAYALTLAATLLTAGVLADRLGRRRVFRAGLVAFTVCSALCGLAPSALVLDLARGRPGRRRRGDVRGLARAARRRLPRPRPGRRARRLGRDHRRGARARPARRGRARRRSGLALGLPREPADRRRARLADHAHARRVARPACRAGSTSPGSVLFGAGRSWSCSGSSAATRTAGAAPAVVAALAGGAALLVAFVLVEARSASPMLAPRLFAVPAFSGTALVVFAQSAALYPMFLFLALWMQDVLAIGPLGTGLRLLPLTLVLFVVAPLSGRLTARDRAAHPARRRAACSSPLSLAPHARRRAATSEWTALLPGLVVGGLAIGVISPALAAAMVGVLSADRVGVASGITNTFRQLGIAVGIAALGAILQHEAAGGGAAGFADGLNAVFAVAAAVALAGAAVGLAAAGRPALGRPRARLSAAFTTGSRRVHRRQQRCAGRAGGSPPMEALHARRRPPDRRARDPARGGPGPRRRTGRSPSRCASSASWSRSRAARVASSRREDLYRLVWGAAAARGRPLDRRLRAQAAREARGRASALAVHPHARRLRLPLRPELSHAFHNPATGA